MTKRHSGICPFCKETIIADTLEENYVRRDKCQYPSCKGVIYVCRSPGCDNYAKGGDLYDDELCPECTRGLTSNGGTIAMTALATVVAVLVEKGMNPPKD